QRVEHRRLVGGRRADVPSYERVGRFEGGEPRSRIPGDRSHSFPITASYAFGASRPASAPPSAGFSLKNHAAYASLLTSSGASVNGEFTARISPPIGA